MNKWLWWGQVVLVPSFTVFIAGNCAGLLNSNAYWGQYVGGAGMIVALALLHVGLKRMSETEDDSPKGDKR